MAELDALDQRLLTPLQVGFPLVPRPFAALGEGLGLDEGQVIARLQRLRDARVLRQVAAIFDSRALGYQSALVAAQAPEGKCDEAAALVSAHPGVSHNYRREHALDLWFTLATPPGADLGQAAAALAQRAGLQRHYVLPALKTFRIGVAFDLEGGKAQAQGGPQRSKPQEAVPLTDEDRAAVRVMQDDLELIPEPFAPRAAALGWSQGRLFAWLASAQERRFLRRYAGVLRHREAGFGEGGMGVWAVAEGDIERLGQAFAQDSAVTHCYQRPTFDGWPYSLFTMVHGADRAACQAVLQGLAGRVQGWAERAVLFSTHEYKKERVQYFLEQPC
jgi:DNA-binding Lrp family transcriptional regulator